MDQDHRERSPSESDYLSDLSQMSDFERRMAEEVREKEKGKARDERRLRNATTSRVQAFSKARAPPKLSTTMHGFDRVDDVSPDLGEADAQDTERPSPVTIPATWGSKARQDKNWLRRRIGQDSAEEPPSGVKASPHARITTGLSDDVDWLQVEAEDVIQSVESGSPSRARRNQTLRDHQSVSIDEIIQLEQQEEDDYSAESPVAQASERRRRQFSRRSYQSTESERESTYGSKRRDPMPDSPSRISLRSILDRDNIINNIVDDHNVISAIHPSQRSPRSPLPSLKSSRTVGVTSFEVEALGEASSNRARPQRHDSRELLRQLARSSASPIQPVYKAASPKVSRHGKDKEQPDQQQLDHQEEKSLRRPSQADNSPAPSDVNNDNPVAITKSRSSSQSRRTLDIRRLSEPSVADLADGLDVLPAIDIRDSMQDLQLKTPVVTGAWVDTPFPLRKKQADATDSKSTKAESMQEIEGRETSQNNKGHSTYIAPKSIAPTGKVEAVEDSTLDSLRENAGLDVDHSTFNVDTQLDDETLNLIDNVNVPVSHAARERQLEDQVVKRMGERLRAVRTGLRDTSRGLKRVEREIVTAESTGSSSTSKKHQRKPSTVGCKSCDANEVTLTSLIRKAWLYFTSFFYTWPPSRRWRWLPRLTWLGLATLVVLIWSISETALCEHYCHPRYAVYMNGYGVDINAPVMPYVTATILLARPTMWLWKPLLQSAGVEFEPGRDFPRWGRAVQHSAKRDWMPELRASQGLDVEGFEGGVDWSVLDD